MNFAFEENDLLNPTGCTRTTYTVRGTALEASTVLLLSLVYKRGENCGSVFDPRPAVLRSAGPEAIFQAAAYAVLARGSAAFLFAFLDLEAVGVVVVVGLVRRRRRRGWCWQRGAPDQFKVELTASACGAAVRELGSGAEPRAYGLADGLGLGEGLVACAWPARIRLSPYGTARPRGSPV